jgi:glycosyltransferase involved in cell wall biosynthesis
MYELVSRSAKVHEYELFTVDLGSEDPWQYAGPYRKHYDLRESVRAIHSIPLGYSALRRVNPPGPTRNLTTAAGIVAAERAIAREIKAGSFDLVFLHHSMYTSTPTLLKYLSQPSVFYCQEPRRMTFEASNRRRPRRTPRQIGADLFERALERTDLRAIRHAQVVLCNSYFSREAIYRAYAVNAEVCYLGVDPNVFHPATSAERRNVVLSVGALSPMKGHDLAIRSLACTPTRARPDLEIIYERRDEGYDAYLSHLAGRLKVNLSLLRGLTDDELAARYRSAQATLCTARLEPFGLTTLESISSGTPVVALREGGFREVVLPGRNGVFVDPNPQSIAGGLAEVLSESFPAPAEIAASVIPAWTWESSVGRLHEFLAKALLVH